MIDFDSALIWFDCESLECRLKRARGAAAGCSSCDYQGEYAEYLGTLFANLAIAGALCWAYKLGTCFPYYLDHEDMEDGYTAKIAGDTWRPNTHARAAKEGL